jgi:cytochrome c-type biogenesis protein CcmH
MKRISFWIACIIVVFLAFGATTQVSAQVPEPSDDDVNRIAKQLYCPVCENIPLDVCPTQACIQWRALIREKLAEGKSEQEIKDYFVLHYGDRVLSEPPRRGLNWLVYVLPPAMLLGGGLILFVVFRKMRSPTAYQRPGSEHPITPEDLPEVEDSDEYVRRLEEELRKRQKPSG